MIQSRIMQSRIFEGFACPYFPTFMRFMHVLAVVEQLSCSSASDSPYHSQELFCGTSRSLVSSVLQRPLGVEFGRYKVYIVHICTLCRFRIRFIHFCQAGAAISLALLDQFFVSRAGVATIPLGIHPVELVALMVDLVSQDVGLHLTKCKEILVDTAAMIICREV